MMVRRRVLVIAAVLLAGVAATVLVHPLGEEVAERWVAVTGLVCSLAALAVSLIGLAPKAPPAERVDGANRDLARAVKEQWQAEWRLRRLQDPWPMRVRWDAADPLLSDHAGNVGCDRLDGEFGDIAGLFRRLPGGRLVVLDGLDEIPPPLRGEALRRLNNELDAGAPALLTCRTEAYREIVRECDVFTAAAVIELLPLTLDEVARYLNGTSRRHTASASTKWQQVLKVLAAEPQDHVARVLSETLSVPLMAAMARAIYSDTGADPAELLGPRFADRAVLEAHLLDAYIPAGFAPAPGLPGAARPRWTAAQATRWLAFLARAAERRGSRCIAWWELPDALPRAVRLLPSGLLACAAVTAAWCLAHPVLHVTRSLVGIVLYVAVLGVGLKTQPIPRARAVLLGGAIAGLLTGLMQQVGGPSIRLNPNGAGPMLTVLPDLPLAAYCAAVVTSGLMTALMLGTARIGSRPRPLTIPFRVSGGRRVPADKPAQVLDLARAAGHGLARGVLGGGGFGLIAGLSCGAVVGLRGQEFVPPFMESCKFGISMGLILGLVSGLVGALYRCSERSADTATAPSPHSSLRADRYAAFGRALLGLLFLWPLLLLAAALSGAGMIDDRVAGALVILLFVPLGPLVILLAAWGRLLAARLWLCGLGRLPWRLMSFLAEAHEKGVLRQVGAVYEFRHIRLQERLAHPHRLSCHLAGDSSAVGSSTV
ncbi:hypothetical protein [Nonomuraea sp. NPDC050643]|uniref:hypothetical protein n=1 Tax=Nonomuraea sp. NPDC050643 TaxID=3155660 RepID=UPI0033FDA4A1